MARTLTPGWLFPKWLLPSWRRGPAPITPPPTQDVLLDDPMEIIRVHLGVVGSAEIYFKPKTFLPFPKPYSYYVEYALDPNGPWTQIQDAPENWVVIDMGRHTYDVIAELWYRVVLIDNAATAHASRSVQVGNRWGKRNFVIAKEVCRQAYQQMRIGDNSPGYLLKKKLGGTGCQNCSNPLTGQATNSQCSECYGTRISGGYYTPYPMILQVQTMTAKQIYREQTGKEVLPGYQAVGVNFPPMLPDDVWVEANSGKRYKIGGEVRPLAAIQNIPLIVTVLLQPIETTDVIYQLQIPDEQ